MKLPAVIIILCLVSPVFAATITNSFSAYGVGALTVNSDQHFGAGINNDSLSGNSGSVLVTAPGEFRYQTFDTLDATFGNNYNSTGYSRFNNGGVFSESVNMETSTPYQSVTDEHYGVLQSAEIDTAKYVSNGDLSMGQEAAWDGAGVYVRDIDWSVYQVRKTMGNTYTYRTDGTDHRIVATNSTGGAKVRPEFSFIDFSDSFITNDTALGVNETNTSEIMPETMGGMNQ
jgi:hypothetical protein